MTNRYLLIPLLLLIGCPFLHAQQKVNGKIFSATNDSVIRAATVYNKTMASPVYSRKDGTFSIPAAEGDTLIFSAIGFTPDTVKVLFHMLHTSFNVSLQMKIITLQTVKVISSYRQDSLNRRAYYNNIYKKQPGITGFNRPADGFGISLSPISYFSKDAKQKRILKKRLLKEEKDDYIDRSFPVEWVERLTSLKGDSLSLFVYRYRPSYAFCRKTDRQAMLMYINDRLKEFRKSKNSS